MSKVFLKAASKLKVGWLRDLHKNSKLALGGMLSSDVCKIHRGKSVEDTSMCFKVHRRSEWLIKELLEIYDFGIQVDSIEKTVRGTVKDGSHLKFNYKWYKVLNSGSDIRVYVLKDSVIIGKILREVDGYVYKFDKFRDVFELYGIVVDEYKCMTENEVRLLRSYFTEFDAKVYLNSKKYIENTEWEQLELTHYVTYKTRGEEGYEWSRDKLITKVDFEWLTGKINEVGYQTFKVNEINRLLAVVDSWTNKVSNWSSEQRKVIDTFLSIIDKTDER